MSENKQEIEVDLLREEDNANGRTSQIVSDSDLLPVESKEKRCLFVTLNPEASYFNLFSFYLVQFTYVCCFTFIDAAQDYLLQDKNYYNIDPSKSGEINGDILLYDTLYLVN